MTTQENPMPTLEQLAQQLATALANLDDAKHCQTAEEFTATGKK